MTTTKTLAALVLLMMLALGACSYKLRVVRSYPFKLRPEDSVFIDRTVEGMHWREAYRIMGEWQNCDTITGRRQPCYGCIPRRLESFHLFVDICLQS